MKKPIISILLLYIAGIIYGRYLPLHLIHLTVFITFILIISLAFRIVNSKICSRLPTAYYLLPAFILCGAIAINYQSITLPDNHISNLINNEKVSIEGIIYKPPEVLENKTRLYLDVESVSGKDTNGKVRITLYRQGQDKRCKAIYAAKFQKPRWI